MKVLHVTDASAAGVLSSVTALVVKQSEFADVTFGYVPRVDSPDADEIAAGMGASVRVVRWEGSFRELALLRGLVRVLKSEAFDLVHVHSSRAGLIGRLLTRRYRRPVVYSPHCFAFERNDYPGPIRLFFREVERAALLFGDRLILVSESERRVAEQAFPSAKTAVVANAVNASELDRIASAAREGSPDHALRIVHIGRISGQKRPELFSEVRRLVMASAQSPVAFRWLGDGDRSLLDDDIEVSGWLDRKAAMSAIASADIVLFTSSGEGLSMALVESQAMGVAAVACDVTGVTDVIRENATGLLAQDAEGLASAVLRLVHDDELRARLGRASAANVRRNFDMSTLGQQSFEAYRHLGIEIPEELTGRELARPKGES